MIDASVGRLGRNRRSVVAGGVDATTSSSRSASFASSAAPHPSSSSSSRRRLRKIHGGHNAASSHAASTMVEKGTADVGFGASVGVGSFDDGLTAETSGSHSPKSAEWTDASIDAAAASPLPSPSTTDPSSSQSPSSPLLSSPSPSSSDLSALLERARHLHSVDRVLDARSVVDSIRSTLRHHSPSGLLESTLFPAHRSLLDSIVAESDRVNFVLDELRKDEEAGWILCRRSGNRKKKGGGGGGGGTGREAFDIEVHYKNEEGSPIHAVKTSTILDGFGPRDFITLASLFVEADLMPAWFPGGVLQSCEALAEPSIYKMVAHMKMSFGRYSPLSDRDAVVEGRGYFLPDRNACLVLSRSIDISEHCAIPPPEEGVVRIDTFSAFYVELLPRDRILLRFIAHDDLKLKYVPAAVQNYLSQGAMPTEMIRGIVRAVRNAEGSEWERRIRDRTEVYADIERRAYGGTGGDGAEGEEGEGALSREAVRGAEAEVASAAARRAELSAAAEAEVRELETIPPPPLPPRARRRRPPPPAANDDDWSASSLLATAVALIVAVPLARYGTRLSLALSVLPLPYYLALVALTMAALAALFRDCDGDDGSEATDFEEEEERPMGEERPVGTVRVPARPKRGDYGGVVLREEEEEGAEGASRKIRRQKNPLLMSASKRPAGVAAVAAAARAVPTPREKSEKVDTSSVGGGFHGVGTDRRTSGNVIGKKRRSRQRSSSSVRRASSSVRKSVSGSLRRILPSSASSSRSIKRKKGKRDRSKGEEEKENVALQ